MTTKSDQEFEKALNDIWYKWSVATYSIGDAQIDMTVDEVYQAGLSAGANFGRDYERKKLLPILEKAWKEMYKCPCERDHGAIIVEIQKEIGDGITL